MLLDGLSVWCIVLLYVFFKTYSSIPDTHSYSSMLYTPDTHPNSTNSFFCGGNGESYICVFLILLVLHTVESAVSCAWNEHVCQKIQDDFFFFTIWIPRSREEVKRKKQWKNQRLPGLCTSSRLAAYGLRWQPVPSTPNMVQFVCDDMQDHINSMHVIFNDNKTCIPKPMTVSVRGSTQFFPPLNSDPQSEGFTRTSNYQSYVSRCISSTKNTYID